MGISLVDIGGLGEKEIRALRDSPLCYPLAVALAYGSEGMSDRPHWDSFISDGW
jgi:hypothetical protein